MKGFCRNKNHEWDVFEIKISIPYCTRCGCVRNFKPRTKVDEVLPRLLPGNIKEKSQSKSSKNGGQDE